MIPLNLSPIAQTEFLMRLLLCFLIITVSTSLYSAERLPLWTSVAPVDGKTTEKANAYLSIHQPEKNSGIAMVICPGGGYGGLVKGPEGHGIAKWLNTHGITGAVLEYRLPKGRNQVPLLDAQRAIQHLRANAKELKINPDKIGIIGFSAGGHLAASSSVHYLPGDSSLHKFK
jgi:acetyl esterase/lipase